MTKRLRLILVTSGAILASACGQVSPLAPGPGQALPVKPLLARATPTAEQLLAHPTYSRPERIDELMKRSTPRRPDRFDLPPADGGAAPVLPDTEQPSSSEQPSLSDPR